METDFFTPEYLKNQDIQKWNRLQSLPHKGHKDVTVKKWGGAKLRRDQLGWLISITLVGIAYVSFMNSCHSYLNQRSELIKLVRILLLPVKKIIEQLNITAKRNCAYISTEGYHLASKQINKGAIAITSFAKMARKSSWKQIFCLLLPTR